MLKLNLNYVYLFAVSISTERWTYLLENIHEGLNTKMPNTEYPNITMLIKPPGYLLARLSPDELKILKGLYAKMNDLTLKEAITGMVSNFIY